MATRADFYTAPSMAAEREPQNTARLRWTIFTRWQPVLSASAVSHTPLPHSPITGRQCTNNNNSRTVLTFSPRVGHEIVITNVKSWRPSPFIQQNTPGCTFECTCQRSRSPCEEERDLHVLFTGYRHGSRWGIVVWEFSLDKVV